MHYSNIKITPLSLCVKSVCADIVRSSNNGPFGTVSLVGLPCGCIDTITELLGRNGKKHALYIRSPSIVLCSMETMLSLQVVIASPRGGLFVNGRVMRIRVGGNGCRASPRGVMHSPLYLYNINGQCNHHRYVLCDEHIAYSKRSPPTSERAIAICWFTFIEHCGFINNRQRRLIDHY